MSVLKLSSEEKRAIKEIIEQKSSWGRDRIRRYINDTFRKGRLPVGEKSIRNFLNDIGHKGNSSPRDTYEGLASGESPERKIYDEKSYQIQLLTNEIEGLKKELSEAEKRWFTDTHLLSVLKKSIDAFPMPNKLPIVKPKKVSAAPEEAVLLLSDLHAGKRVFPEEIEFMNEYNFDILCKRLWDAQDSVVNITDIFRTNFNVDTLNLILLGDMINDTLREESKKTNEFPEFVSVMLLSSVLGQMISSLSSFFSKVVVYGVVGNEARITKKPESALRYNNLDWLVYQITQLMLNKNSRVEFVIPHSPKYVIDIMGWKILIQHGDDAFSGTGGYGGVPWYPLHRTKLQENFDRTDRQLRATVKKETSGFGHLDYFFMAHKHPKELTWDNIIVNGSMVGIEAYAGNKLVRRSPPRQRFFGFNAKYGKSWDYNLYCADNKPHGFICNKDNLMDEVDLSSLEISGTKK
jgi:hypothetical protein